MGANKAFLSINGERLIDRTLRLCRSLFEETILVTQTPLTYLDLDVCIVTDLKAGKGPLMGIYTGLFYASTSHVFVLACDMPFLDYDFMKYMMDVTSDNDIVVPHTPGGFEPLHAIYARRLMGPIKRLLDENLLKITGFFPGAKKKVIGVDEIARFNGGEKMFFNLNRPEDLKELERFSS